MLIKNPIIANKKPSGNVNITTTSPVDVTNYATATVVDSNLVAGNIKSGVSILGVAGNVTPAKTEQTKTVTFSSDGQEVTPDSGLVLSKVTINKPANLLSENIKSGVTIAGVAGSYSGGTDYLAKHIEQSESYTYTNNNITSIASLSLAEDKKITSIDCPNVTTVDFQALYNCTALTSINLPAITTMGNYAFGGTAITSINLPLVTTLAASAFVNCSSLTSASFAAATKISEACFIYCSQLSSCNFPLVTLIETNAFRNCTSLVSINLPAVRTIQSNVFNGCTNLTSITLGANQVCTLNSTNAIPATSNHHINIYVPISLVASYRSATNWSTLYNNGYISILPIDGQLITTSVTNGSYSGDIAIANNGTATVTLSANSGYDLPSSITVSGASYTYNSTTGVVSLSNPTGAVSITAVCVQAVSGYTLTIPYPIGHHMSGRDDTIYVKIGSTPANANDYDYKATAWGMNLKLYDGSDNVLNATQTINNVSKVYLWTSGNAHMSDFIPTVNGVEQSPIDIYSNTYSSPYEYTLTDNTSILLEPELYD